MKKLRFNHCHGHICTCQKKKTPSNLMILSQLPSHKTKETPIPHSQFQGFWLNLTVYNHTLLEIIWIHKHSVKSLAPAFCLCQSCCHYLFSISDQISAFYLLIPVMSCWVHAWPFASSTIPSSIFSVMNDTSVLAVLTWALQRPHGCMPERHALYSEYKNNLLYLSPTV